MANDRYNDLMSSFEGEKKAAPPPVKKATPPAQDKNNLKGGVYFSNPPKAMDKNRANANRPTTNRPAGRKAPGRKVDAKGVKKKNPIVRFFTSKGFRNFIIMIVVIALVSSVICWYGLNCINDVLALDAEDTSIEVTIQGGMTDDDVLDVLKEKKLIDNKEFCKLFITIFDKEGAYIPGVYTLNPTMGVEKMIATMKTDYTGGETITLTFPEGWTIQQIAEKLEVNEVCTASSFITTLQTVDFSNEYDFIKTIDDKEKRFNALEGFVYPDTYEFYVGENASSVVRRFLDNFEAKWTEEYQKKADEMGCTVDDIIVMASILQMEAGSNDQMEEIASVLYNRLEKPSTFPLLQCDSTEDYLLDNIKPTLSNSTEDTQKYLQYRDLYDTYSESCVGLPVGAIANPGDAAINAALNPAETDYYYFCHDTDSGEVYYASSFAEHERNMREAGL